MGKRLTIADRFMAKVNKTETCWLWTGNKADGEYGQVKVAGVPMQAHRAAYRLFVGHIPGDLLVCHKCDVPACVNPEHLFLGTASDNRRDCFAKGRDNIAQSIATRLARAAAKRNGIA